MLWCEVERDINMLDGRMVHEVAWLTLIPAFIESNVIVFAEINPEHHRIYVCAFQESAYGYLLGNIDHFDDIITICVHACDMEDKLHAVILRLARHGINVVDPAGFEIEIFMYLFTCMDQ